MFFKKKNYASYFPYMGQMGSCLMQEQQIGLKK
jgi:hypothetical protein